MPKDKDLSESRAVQLQLRIWDALLEIRIRLQTMLVEVNKLPQDPEYWSMYKSMAESNGDTKSPSLQAANKSLLNLLELFVQLKNELMQSNSETKSILAGNTDNKSKNDEDEEILSSESEEEEDPDKDLGLGDSETESLAEEDEGIGPSSEDEVQVETPKVSRPRKRHLNAEDYEIELKKRHESFASYRNQIIQKWNDRTQVASGKLNKRNFSAFQVSTLKQIEQIMADKERLIRRTKLRRSEYEPIGKSSRHTTTATEEDEEGNYDPEIFDDDDFYHQLLREVIERKTSNMTDPIQLSRHWLELQKLRSKTKRKVDTKASKARKIRYEVFPKLVNLMAPSDETLMTEHARKELFASLFGSNNTVE